MPPRITLSLGPDDFPRRPLASRWPGLIGMIRAGEIPAGSRVLYVHLGGQPCLSAYAGVL